MKGFHSHGLGKKAVQGALFNSHLTKNKQNIEPEEPVQFAPSSQYQIDQAKEGLRERNGLDDTNSKFMKALQDEDQPIEEVQDLDFKEIELIEMIQNETNNIINQKDYTSFNVHGRVWRYDKYSIFIFRGDFILRKAIVWFIHWKIFEYLVMVVILLNSLMIASYDFKDRTSQTRRNQIIDMIQLIFQIIFVIECTCKIIAQGFVHRKNSYLRNGWNLIDFIVIILGLLDLSMNSTNLKSIRTIRVLQPLRNITHFEKLKQLANTLVKSLPSFANVSFFLAIIFIIFGIFGLQLYSDAFYWRCRLTEAPYYKTFENGSLNLVWEKDPAQSGLLCSPNGFGTKVCLAGTYCGNPYRVGLDGTFDNVIDDTFINYGVLTFDNIGKSLLSVFQILTNDNWALTMYNLMYVDIPVIAPLFICFVVILGSFFLINIILAVILDSFIGVQQEDMRNQFILQHLMNLAGVEEVDNEFNKRIKQMEVDSNDLKNQIDPVKTVDEHDDTTTTMVAAQQETTKVVEIDEKEVIRLKKQQELIERKELKDYIRDQLKYDIDFLKNVIISEDKSGSISRLTALKRAINVVEPPEVEHQRKFKANLRHLRMISVRAKKNILFTICLKISQNKIFNNYMIPLMIILNTIVLASDQYPQTTKSDHMLEDINFAFFFFFFFEVLVKMLGLGIKTYLSEGFNIFDTFIVMISMIDTVIQTVVMATDSRKSGYNSGSSQDMLMALRAFRLLRIFKLANNWKKFNDLLKTVWKTVKDISTFSLFLLLFTFIYTLLGMELFAFGCKKSIDDKIDMENGTYPLNNFNSFYEAFLTMFVLLTGDQWTSIMLDFYRAVNPTLALIFFVSFMIIGQYMLLNLFLAILLQNFDEDSVEQEMQIKLMKQNQIDKAIFHEKIRRFFKKVWKQFLLILTCKCITRNAKKEPGLLPGDDDPLDVDTFKYVDKDKTKKKARGFLKKINTINPKTIKSSLKEMEGTTLYLFSMENRFRRLIYLMINNKVFDYLILAVILLSTVQLAIETPLIDPTGQKAIILGIIDAVTTSIFTAEIILKVITFGFFLNGEHSFMRSSSNILDFIVTSLSIISLVADGVDLSVFKVLRMFKILRPLRFITRIQTFQVAIQALINATTNVIGVLFISMLFYMIFGIIGVNYFKGQFSYCSLSHVEWSDVRNTGVIFYMQDCFNYGGEWIKTPQHFDNIMESMMTLFQMATLSDWLNVMYNGMSITGIESDFILKYNPATCIYFIIFVIVGAFFTLNLFVGIVISTYNREKEKIAKDYLLKERQKEWLYAKQIIFRQKLQVMIVEHQNKFRNFLLKIQKSRRFEGFIMLMIILNTMVLMFKWAGEPSYVTQTTEILNYIFTSIFTLEMIIKLISLGSIYFREKWNRFDFTVILLTYIFIAISQTTAIDFGAQTTLLRSFRILRIFKFFKATKNIKIMFNTFIVTLPAMTSIGGLLFLLIFVYAVMGVNLFGSVKMMPPYDEVQNFQSFGPAFLVLIKIATGDGWAELMNILRMQKSVLNQCVDNPTYQDYADNDFNTVGCGSSQTAVTYFYSYLLVVKLVFLNLFIAVILEGFEVVNMQERRTLNSDLLEDLRDKWNKFDNLGTGFIKIFDLALLLRDLGDPIGWGPKFEKGETQEKRDAFIKSLNLPIYNDFKDYQYIDVALSMCRRLIIEDELEQILEQNPRTDSEAVRKQIEKELLDLDDNDDNISSVKKMKKEEKRLKQQRDKKLQGDTFGAHHEQAARLLIRHLRVFVQANRLKKGIKTRRYTKEELDAIDAALMNQFKVMVEGAPQSEEEQKNEVQEKKDSTQGVMIEATTAPNARDTQGGNHSQASTSREPLNKKDSLNRQKPSQLLPSSSKSRQRSILPSSFIGGEIMQTRDHSHLGVSANNLAAATNLQASSKDSALPIRKQSSIHESIFELSEANYGDNKPQKLKSQDELMIEEEMNASAKRQAEDLADMMAELDQEENQQAVFPKLNNKP